MNTKYYFLPWARQGLATNIGKIDTLGGGLPGTVKQSVYLLVNNHDKTKSIQLRLHGPGDVTGIQRQAIIRTDPKPWTRDFEPNYFPLIEFDNPDFTSLFTPLAADAQGRLRPWICLVVVPKQEGISIVHTPERPLPVLEIKAPALPGRELPDLSESWAWAHVQVVGPESATDKDIEDLLANQPAKNLSRLICPRKLAPNQGYYACLVPAFEAGRKTGLGLPLSPEDELELRPAWLSGAGAAQEVSLPLYYQWEFSTGAGGDFESLLRKLEPQQLPHGVGKRDMIVSNLPFGLPDLGPLSWEGALRAPRPELVEPSRELGFVLQFSTALAEELNKETVSEALRMVFEAQGVNLPEYARITMDETSGGYRVAAHTGKTYFVKKMGGTFYVFDIPEEFPSRLATAINLAPSLESAEAGPVVGLPIYGGIQASQPTVTEAGDGPVWLRQLNLDPRYRSVAGLGTMVVQDQQEQLMTAAWTQLGDGSINQDMRQLQFAREVNTAIYNKKIKPLAVDGKDNKNKTAYAALLQFTAPSHAFVPVQSEAIAQGAGSGASSGSTATKPIHSASFSLQQTALPGSILSSAFRRATRTRGPVGNRTKPKSEAGVMNPIASYIAPPPIIAQYVPPSDKIQIKDLLDTSPAASLYKAYLENWDKVPDAQPAAAPFAEQQVTSFVENLLQNLDPSKSMLELAEARLKQKGNGTTAESLAATPPPESGTAAVDPLARFQAAPQFPEPMYKVLSDISPDFLLPGAEFLPENSVTLLETNPRFIEAYMVGLNHEMSRELLWREFPVDQRASYFPLFWDQPDRADATTTCPPVRAWNPENELGGNFQVGATGDQLVLLFRGELLLRYPNTIIYLEKAGAPPEEKRPIIQGQLKPNISLVGFDIPLEQLQNEPGWYFVVQQQPTEPRFGMDIADPASFNKPAPGSWNDLDWGHLVKNQEELNQLNYASANGRLKNKSAGSATWGRNSAHMALITLQRPFQVKIRATIFLPPPIETPD